MRICIPTYTQTIMHTLTRTHNYARTPTNPHTHTHTHTFPRVHTHTHTRTGVLFGTDNGLLGEMRMDPDSIKPGWLQQNVRGLGAVTSLVNHDLTKVS